MVCLGRQVWYPADYLIREDLRLFRKVSVRDPWQKSDHYMILGYLRSATLR